MNGGRRLSQAISEGDGISIMPVVSGPDDARTAEEQGAEALVLVTAVNGLRGATGLPLLWRPHGSPGDAMSAQADACILSAAQLDGDDGELERMHREALELGLECVVEVGEDEQLELALERVDPEIFLLADRALELLPDVPAGKLAIAEVDRAARDDVAELERAGMDAVIVRAGNIAELIGEPPPEV